MRGLGPQSGGPPKHWDVRQRKRGPGGRHAQRRRLSTASSGMSASNPAALPLTAQVRPGGGPPSWGRDSGSPELMAPCFGPQATLPTCFLPVCSAAPSQWGGGIFIPLVNEGGGICTRLVSWGAVSSSPWSVGTASSSPWSMMGAVSAPAWSVGGGGRYLHPPGRWGRHLHLKDEAAGAQADVTPWLHGQPVAGWLSCWPAQAGLHATWPVVALSGVDVWLPLMFLRGSCGHPHLWLQADSETEQVAELLCVGSLSCSQLWPLGPRGAGGGGQHSRGTPSGSGQRSDGTGWALQGCCPGGMAGRPSSSPTGRWPQASALAAPLLLPGVHGLSAWAPGHATAQPALASR